MKKIGSYIAMLMLLTTLMSSCSGEKWAVSYYVSEQGDDNNLGSQEQPFATLERAREAIRTLKKESGLPVGGIRVVIAEGTYVRTGTFTLEAEDSGTQQCPILYTGIDKALVRFVGGRLLTKWEPVSDPKIRERLDPGVRDSVYECNLIEAGVRDFGSVATPQTGAQRADLLCNQRYMSLARYPDAGEWLLIADVPMSGPKKIFYDGITHYGRFAYEGNRPSRWKDQSNIWMQGYWVHDWRDGIQRAERIDTIKREIYPDQPYHHYGYKKGQRYFFLNILEELTTSGEWFLDRQSGKLYFYPPCPIDQAQVIFPELETPMMELNNTSFVAVEEITFQASRHGGVVMQEGANNQIRGCDLLNMAHLGIDIRNGIHHGVQSCNLYEMAQGAIKITGGDRKTLTASGHFIDNTEIYRNGQIFKTQTPAIEMQGVGIRVSHLYLHDTPHTGIFFYGNDHIFEYCEFTRIAQETGDVGCIYTMADWTFQGNVIRYNYFHDIHSPGHLGCFTVYPDLPNGGMHVHGNIFYNTDWVFHTNSGRGMLIENNLMLETNGISYKIWPFKDIFFHGGAWRMVENLDEVNYSKPPYVTQYPLLKTLAEDMQQADSTVKVMERQRCKDNSIRNNISTGDVFIRFIGDVDFQQVVIENNLIANKVPYTHSPINTYDDFDSYTDNAPVVIDQLKALGNTLMQGDPGIKNPQAGDFSIVPGSPASKVDFDPIPVREIGLKVDQYRKQVTPALR